MNKGFRACWWQIKGGMRKWSHAPPCLLIAESDATFGRLSEGDKWS